MKKRIIAYIIFVQIIIVAALVFNIYQKKKQFSGMVSVDPIKKENIVLSTSKDLRYFYEPKTNAGELSANNVFKIDAFHTINSDSLNERFNYLPEKAKGTFRIITLGDSFTYGAFTDTKNNWTELLEDGLNKNFVCKNIKKIEVINLGVGGYDNKYEVERFRKRGIKYNPDLIIWLNVDMSRVRELLIPLISKYNSIDKKKIGVSDYDQKASWYKAEADLFKLYGYSKLVERNKSAIDSMSDYYKGRVLVIPMPVMVKDNEKKMLKDIVSKKNNWIYFDGLRNIYNANGYGNGYVENDFHPNKKGHQMIAADILNYIKTSKLIPCGE